MHLSGFELAVALLAVAAGALVQGSVGFGMNLVAVPVVALLRPDTVPATFVLLGLPLGLVMAAREHRAIDWRGVGGITAGRVPGTVAGAALVAALPTEGILVIVGLAVVAATVASHYAPRVHVTPRSTVIAGVVSGAGGTAAAIGGPPLALLYQHDDGPVIRSTLAASFVIGSALSITALVTAGEITERHVVLAAALLPAMLLGMAAGSPLSRRLDSGPLRRAVLLVAAAAGLTAIMRGLL